MTNPYAPPGDHRSKPVPPPRSDRAPDPVPEHLLAPPHDRNEPTGSNGADRGTANESPSPVDGQRRGPRDRPRRAPGQAPGSLVPRPPANTPRPGVRPQGWQAAPAGRQQPPDPEAQKAAAQPVVHFALAMLAVMVTMSLPLPWQLASVAFAALAFGLGVRALLRAWQAGLRGFLIPIITTSLLFMGLIGLRTIATVIYWEPMMAHQDCVRQALTIAAQEKCDADFQRALTQNNPLLDNNQLFGSGALATMTPRPSS